MSQTGTSEMAASTTQPARPELSLAVPCYNEEEVLRDTVVQLARTFAEAHVDLELVLVDNGSTDGTAAVIDHLIAEGLPVVKVTVDTNRGYGHGVLAGLRACRGELVGFIHADGQVDPRDVLKVYSTARRAPEPTLAKVRRRFRMDGWTRKLISIAFNLGTNVVFPGLRSIDINGSPKVLPRAALERMNLVSQDWFLDCEMLLKARQMGLAVVEFNVLAQPRAGGKSKVHLEACWEFAWNLLKYRLGRGAPLAPPQRDSAEPPVALSHSDR